MRSAVKLCMDALEHKLLWKAMKRHDTFHAIQILMFLLQCVEQPIIDFIGIHVAVDLQTDATDPVIMRVVMVVMVVVVPLFLALRATLHWVVMVMVMGMSLMAMAMAVVMVMIVAMIMVVAMVMAVAMVMVVATAMTVLVIACLHSLFFNLIQTETSYS